MLGDGLLTKIHRVVCCANCLNRCSLLIVRLYACEFQALFHLDKVARWGECLLGNHGTNGADPHGSMRAGGSHHSSSGTTPPSYEEDRDDGEGGTIPPDDNTYVLPLKLSSCRVLLPQVCTRS
jgi:hypothetical protein